MLSPNGKAVKRKFVDGKIIETIETTTALDEQAIINRKIQLQGRQAQIRQQIMQLKATHDQMTADIVDCDNMLSQFTASELDIPTE